MSKKNFFDENGYIVIENLIPNSVIDMYRKYWISTHAPQYDGTVASMKNKMGWKESSPFINHEPIREILCHDNIYKLFDEIGLEKMGLHLSFTPWYSTEKSWHHDCADGDTVSAENYVGLWIALQDINPDSGPFAFVPGSNNWDFDFSVYKNLNPEQIVMYIQNLLIQNELNDKQQPQMFLPKKGGALLWKGHTIHRGLSPVNTNMPRESIIGHYMSGVKGKWSDQYGVFTSYKDGFYVEHRNQVDDLYYADQYGNLIKKTLND